MSTPYSLDLRMKVIHAIHKEYPILRISKMFGISRNTVYNWKKSYEKTGAVKPKKPGNGKRPIIEDLKKFRDFVLQKPDRTQAEMAEDWGNISPRAISDTLKRAGITYKKNFWVPTKKRR